MNTHMRACLTAGVILLTAIPAFAAFSDVPTTHTTYDAVTYVQQKQIVQGYEDGTFRPEVTINRAEFSKIIIGSQFSQSIIDDCVRLTVKEEGLFSDVPNTAWFAPYVCVAKEHGIIQGYDDGSFRPGQDISFVEAAKIVVKTFGYAVNEEETPWFRPFVQKLEERFAIPATITTFEHRITRGEMAEIVYRLMAQIRNKSSQTYQSLDMPTQTTPTELTKSVTIRYEDVRTRSGIGTSLQRIGADHVIVELPVGQTKTAEFTETWREFTQHLQSTGRTYGIVLQLFDAPCSTSADECFARDGKTTMMDGVQSAALLHDLQAAIAVFEQGYKPTVLYMDASLHRLYTTDPYGVSDIPILLDTLHNATKIPVFITAMVDVNGPIPSYVYEMEPIVDGVGIYIFPSLIGDVSREDMWTSVDGWLSSGQTIAPQPLHIVGIGFPTEAPFGSVAMQTQFADLAETYLTHYGTEYDLASWYGLWDMTTHADVYFRSMGLVTAEGDVRDALHKWLP